MVTHLRTGGRVAEDPSDQATSGTLGGYVLSAELNYIKGSINRVVEEDGRAAREDEGQGRERGARSGNSAPLPLAGGLLRSSVLLARCVLSSHGPQKQGAKKTARSQRT